MQNIFLELKKKPFIYETAHVTNSRKKLLSRGSEYGACQLHIESTHQTFEALESVFSIRHVNIADIYFTKNLLWSDCCRSYN